jgi:hypothetical protein
MPEASLTYDFLASESAFAKFLAQFEEGTLPRPDWTHAAHLAVGTWYLLSFPEKKAIERVRAGIRHYNECAGVRNTPDSGYHETLTRFWIRILSNFLESLDRGSGKLVAIRHAVAEFGSRRDLFREYYSFDVVASREARARWIPPDKIPAGHGNKSAAGSI